MNEQELQKAFIQYLAQKSGAKSQQELEAYIQQLGEEGLKQEYAQFMQMVQQQQVQSAKFGAKLDYLKRLRGQCPEGYEMQYYKAGGQLCKKCMKKAQEGEKVEAPQGNAVDQFKCGRKMKKKACGGEVKKDQKGNKVTLKKETTKGDTTTRHWSDGTTSSVTGGNGDESWPEFTGRDGKKYTPIVYPRTKADRRADAQADSVYREDWAKKTVPALKKKKQPNK